MSSCIADHTVVTPLVELPLLVKRVLFGFAGLFILAPLLSSPARAQGPCCVITKIDARAGLVTAQVNATRQTFEFKVTDANLLATLRTGAGVYANFATHQVSLDGKKACCAIVSIQNATPNQGAALHSGQTSQQPSQSSDPDKGKKKPGGDKKTVGGKNTLGTEGTVVEPAPEPTTEHAIRAATAAPRSGGNDEPKKSSSPLTGTSQSGAPSSLSVAPVVTGGTKNSGALSPPKIESLAVFPGPIPGGQSSGGKVTLTAPAASTPVIVQLSSDKPEAASVPTTVTIQKDNAAPFVITTFGVDKPVDVAIKAQLRDSSDVFTSKMTVRPPQLSMLECSPNRIPSGAPIACKVWLDGKVAGTASQGVSAPSRAHGIQVQVTTDKPALASPQTVVVPSGTDRAEFHIPTIGDAQGGPIRVFASYQGMTKSAPVELTPAMIKDFGCYVGTADLSRPGAKTCTMTAWGGMDYGIILHLTNSQGQETLISLSEPGRVHHASWARCISEARIPAGQAVVQVSGATIVGGYFEPVPKTENHTILIQDPVSGTKLSTTFEVVPARIAQIGFGETAAAAQNLVTVNSVVGQKVKVWVTFDAPPAPTDWQSQNAWLDVVYGGSIDPNRGNVAVQGPTNPAIKEQKCANYSNGWQCLWENEGPGARYFGFEVTVGACSKVENPNGCQATVKVSSNQAIGSQTGTINVISQ